MLKTLTVLVFPVFLTTNANAGTTDSLPSGASQQVSLVIHKTVGDFERSHDLGFGVEYAISRKRFGRHITVPHQVSWIGKGGADYFIGRSKPTEGYAFRYNNYLYLHLMGGAVYNPVSFINSSLTAGPGAGFYNGSVTVGFNAALAVNVFVEERFSVGPAVTFRKHREAEGLWTGAVRLGYTF
ncbi:MAG: hypothetical protein ABWZ25_03160 [Chitinophagaceae bacterium]